MYFLDKRVKVICDELKKLAIKQKEALNNIRYKKGCFKYIEAAHSSDEPFESFDSKTMHWYGPDEHYWFSSSYTVSEGFADKPLWLHICTQIEEWDDAKNPQFLLFVNGEIVQGIDMNHRYVLLSEKARKGDRYDIELQAYTGILHTEFSLILDVCEIDPLINKLYYDLTVPLNSFSRLDKDGSARRRIEKILNDTVNLLDLRTAYSDEFYKSVASAAEFISSELYSGAFPCDEVIASCIGHTHIDVAWWWTVEQTREKTARSFATVLKLMDEYPNYRFMSSQPQLYEFVKERYPKLYDRIKERIKEGRWEAEGGMWVEADCNLTSGESLVRQFIYGKRFFKEEFGVDNKILWLPDVFGYSGALPQIMKKSGIDYFMTTKLSWNQINKIPCDTFMWKGIDGTEVLTHLITTLGVGQSKEDFFTTYNGMLHPDAIIGGWERYQNKDINNDILISYGYGDGGGGPTREMLETSLRMEKGITGLPKVRQAFAGTYFRELDDRVKGSKRLPKWEGELYFEYHRGTYTSMARNKRSNRKSELAMMDLELLSVMAENNIAYPRAEIDKIWKVILLNQFHDILPGSSIHEVYEVTKKEYAEIADMMSDMTAACIDGILEKSEYITIFNTTGFERNDVVRLNVDATALKDEEGNIYEIQKRDNDAIVYIKGLPAKGYKTFEPVTDVKISRESAFKISDDRHLETPYYIVDFDEFGMISGLYDKENDREVLKQGEAGNLLRMYEDKPIYYDNWDIDIFYTEKSWIASDYSEFVWENQGNVCITLHIVREISNSKIDQRIHFYADSRRIDFETVVDWKEHQHILKVYFPTDVHTDEAAFDIQFGNLKRKTHKNTSWDKARFESCGQKWMDVSEGHYGVSLLNDCKYGHSVENGEICLTLIKSGIEPNPVTDQETHVFTYSLLPHSGQLSADITIKEAYFLNQSVIAVKGGTPNDVFSFASVNKPNVIIETIKKAEDNNGYIIRMYECENALTKFNLNINKAFSKAYSCNLLEENEKELTAANGSVELTMRPYEIFTVRIC